MSQDANASIMEWDEERGMWKVTTWAHGPHPDDLPKHTNAPATPKDSEGEK